MNQYERYKYLAEHWTAKMAEYKAMQEMAEKQVNYYTMKMIEYEKVDPK